MMKVFQWISTYTAVSFIDTYKDNNKVLYANNFWVGYKELDMEELLQKKEHKLNIWKFNVYSWIATLADNLYKVKRDPLTWIFYSQNWMIIEKEIIVPLYKITKFTKDYIILPYDNDNKIINEDILKNKFPNAYNYLLTIKNLLQQRDKWKTEKYDSWYAYWRRQWLANIQKHKVLFIPKMVSKTLKPKNIDLNIENEDFERFAFVSWYVISNLNEDVIDYFLSDEFIKKSEMIGKEFPGKTDNYYSLSKNNLNEILNLLQ